MKELTRQRLELLDDTLHKIINLTVEKLMDDGLSTSEAVEAMVGISAVVGGNHANTICSLVVTLMEWRGKTGATIPEDLIRGLVDEEVQCFQGMVERGINVSLEERHLPNLWDPNARIREEILETINAKL